MHPLEIAAEIAVKVSMIENAAMNAAAEVIFDMLPPEARADVGQENLFGETITKVDVARWAVRDALSKGEIGRFGRVANFLFS